MFETFITKEMASNERRPCKKWYFSSDGTMAGRKRNINSQMQDKMENNFNELSIVVDNIGIKKILVVKIEVMDLREGYVVFNEAVGARFAPTATFNCVS